MTSTQSITAIESVTLEVPDPAAVTGFLATAFGLSPDVVGPGPTDAASSGFRAFTFSLVVSQPANVDELVDSALAAGATPLKPVRKSLWGYGGVVRAPDGSIWKVATSKKKNTGPPKREIDDVVLLLGVDDMTASKAFYVDRGFEVARSFGRKYAEFAAPFGRIKLALYGRDALAKDAGVSPEGSGSHCIAIRSGAGPFTDPDGFEWEAA